MTPMSYPLSDQVKEMTWNQIRDYICFDLKTGEVLVVEIPEEDAADE